MNARQDLVRILLPKSTFTDLFFLDSVCILHSCSRPPKTKSLGLVNDVDVGHQSISKISELSMDDDDDGAIEREPILKFTWRNTYYTTT